LPIPIFMRIDTKAMVHIYKRRTWRGGSQFASRHFSFPDKSFVGCLRLKLQAPAQTNACGPFS
jgi:hypothetical protein